MNDVWNYTILNNTVKNIAIAASIIGLSVILLSLFASVVIKRIQAMTLGTKSTIDDFIIEAIRKSVLPVLYVAAFYFGVKYLTLPGKFDSVLQIGLMVAITFFSIRTFSSLARYLFKRTSPTAIQGQKQSNGILLILQIILWLAGSLFLIDNLGYDITTIIAGLGIGGIAIALAAQTILGDLFSYLVIFFDKPFETGDFIIVDDKMGTVEYIGIKTTRLKTLGGEQLICSNTDLTNSRVHNYKRMQERRVVFSIGVVYSTEAGKLRKIPRIIRNVIESLEQTRFDRAHFQSFGDFSLNFEVVFYVLSPDYNIYMDKQQSINLLLFEIFRAEGIEFAFPTQTLFMNSKNGRQLEPFN